jgi:hypothetical protein
MTMTTTNFAEQWKSMMQNAFLPTSAISATLGDNARHFWEMQDKILDNMQALSNGWFERRHTGTHSACEAAERMCGTNTMVDVIQAYQDWSRGVYDRLMADTLACQRQIIAVAGGFASPPLAPSVSEKEAELARSQTKAPARSKTA